MKRTLAEPLDMITNLVKAYEDMHVQVCEEEGASVIDETTTREYAELSIEGGSGNVCADLGTRAADAMLAGRSARDRRSHQRAPDNASAGRRSDRHRSGPACQHTSRAVSIGFHGKFFRPCAVWRKARMSKVLLSLVTTGNHE